MNLSAIFINFNSGTQLRDAVEKIKGNRHIDKIVIVDNGSTDNSIANVILKNSEKIEILKNKTNLGFYKAANKAIRQSFINGAQSVIILDFDLNFSNDFISKLQKARGDIIAPVLKFKRSGKVVYDYGGKINWLVGRSTHLEKEKPEKKMEKFDFVSGGCTIFQKKVFEKIGFFDEDYFLYYGDSDFSIRAKNAGLNLVLDQNTIVEHKLEITSQTKNVWKLRMALRDNLVFINKWVPFYFKPLAYLYFILLSIKVYLSLI